MLEYQYMETIALIGIGLALGVTTVIPGVSTGTLAVVFNIYDRLIEVVTPNIKKIVMAWKFLLPLAVGGFAGIFLFSRLVTMLLTNHPVQTYWFFIGIIAGGLPMIYRRVREPGTVLPCFPAIVCGVIALVLMIFVAVLRPATDAQVYTVLTPHVFAMLEAAGALAAVALIVPGTSGSFLLLVIGLYRTVIQAVGDLNIPLLVSVAVGAAFGLFVGAALVRFLLAKARKPTYGAVLGLVAGSLFVLFPGELGSGAAIFFSVLSALAGFAISFIFGRRKE
jgi:putative membrane protein